MQFFTGKTKYSMPSSLSTSNPAFLAYYKKWRYDYDLNIFFLSKFLFKNQNKKFSGKLGGAQKIFWLVS